MATAWTGDGCADTRTRVAFVFLDLSDGGAERLTLATCRHLDRTRYVPSVVCLRGGGALVQDAVAQGLAVHSLGRMRRPHDWPAVLAAARWLRATRTDVAHVQLYSRASPYGRLAARLAGVRLVVAHEWCRPSPPGLARRLADRALRPGTRFIAASQALRRDLLAEGVPPERVTVVYGGIEAEQFAPGSRKAARQALGLPQGRPIVLVPARLHPMKGHVDLLAGLPELRRLVQGVLVLCAGDGPLRAVLPALAAACGASGAIEFLGQRRDMAGLLAACDLVALPSRVEGLPSVLLEALAAERAVVATRAGGVPELLADGVGGWTVPVRDPAALARALAEALGDPVGRRARARAGRRLVLERFRADQAARRLERAYEVWLAKDAMPRAASRGGLQ